MRAFFSQGLEYSPGMLLLSLLDVLDLAEITRDIQTLGKLAIGTHSHVPENPGEDKHMLFYFPDTNQKILVHGNEVFVNKVVADLTTIRSGWPLGERFFREIIATRWRIKIEPRLLGPFNECSSDADGLNVLAYGIRMNDALAKRGALQFVFNLAPAQREGLLNHVASRLVTGISLATYDSRENASRYRPNPIYQTFEQEKALHRRHLETLLVDADAWPRVPPNYERDLQRILRTWLPPGIGCNCRINYDPDSHHQCADDPLSPIRLPVIGLFHEMVHAWRYMTGKGLYIKNPDIEEVITTGLAPYQYEPYSENLFRALYQPPGGPANDIRLSY